MPIGYGTTPDDPRMLKEFVPGSVMMASIGRSSAFVHIKVTGGQRNPDFGSIG
jgi:hypothetical protein